MHNFYYVFYNFILVIYTRTCQKSYSRPNRSVIKDAHEKLGVLVGVLTQTLSLSLSLSTLSLSLDPSDADADVTNQEARRAGAATLTAYVIRMTYPCATHTSLSAPPLDTSLSS